MIADKLEAVARGDIDRLMIFMPPRHGKSTLASRHFPAWCLGRRPDMQFIASSYNSDLASDFGRDVRNIVNSPQYHALFEDVALAADSQAANRWHTNAGGSYVAAGVGTAITGRGANVLLIDDPLKDRAEADSQNARDNVWNWYTSTAYTRLMPGGAIVLIQTRWHDDDLAGRLLDAQAAGGDEWDVLDLPAINDQGQALWPDWYPVPALERIRTAIGERDWAALYQQQPFVEDGNILKASYWRYWTEPGRPPDADIYFTIASLDTAYTAKETNDYSACTVWHVYRDTNGNTRLFLRYAWAERLEFPELVDMIQDTAAHFKVDKLIIEKKASGLSVIQELRRRWPEVSVHPVEPKGDKVARAYAVSAMLEAGMVYVPTRPGQPDKPKEFAQQVIDQCASFPNGKHDDLTDTVTQALKFVRDAGLELFAEDAPPPDDPMPRRARY